MHPLARNLLIAGGVFGLGVAASPWIREKLSKAQAKTAIAVADGECEPEETHKTIRTAGPDAMRDAPVRRWDRVDQAVDESFPASDPPATY